MLMFDKFKLRYIANIIFSNTSTVVARFDTGAENTVLSYEAVKKGFSVKDAVLDAALADREKVRLSGAVKDFSTKAVPCVIPNVSVGGMHLDRFFFMASKDIHVSLIGVDFINACNVIKQIGGSMQINAFDKNLYESSFKLSYSGVDVCSIDTVLSDPIAWYAALSDIDKSALIRYSALLDSSLRNGVFYEELRPLLDGFRKQYNV